MPDAVVQVKVADLPQVQAALTEAREALESQRRTMLAAVRASCACDSCKAHLAGLLARGPLPAGVEWRSVNA